MMKQAAAFLFLLCSLLALSACSEKKGDRPASAPALTKEALPSYRAVYAGATPEDQVKNKIVRYNELIAYGYRNFDMNPLQEVATVDQAERAYTHMAALGEGGVRMDSKLKKIDFDPILFPDQGTARVSTRETWDFAYHDVKTGAGKGEEKGFLYLVNYTLKKQEGRWTITDIVASSNEKPHAAPAPRRIEADKKSPAAPQHVGPVTPESKF